MVILAELVFENEFEDDWNLILQKDDKIIAEVMSDIIAERMQGEAKVKIKKFRMEKIKNER